MLPKKHRGLSPDQVSELFTKEHQTLSNHFFRINYRFCDQSRAQFAVMVQPKVERSAVSRNRLRRRVYEVIRLHFESWTTGVRVVILVKKNAALLDRAKVREEFLAIFKRFVSKKP